MRGATLGAGAGVVESVRAGIVTATELGGAATGGSEALFVAPDPFIILDAANPAPTSAIAAAPSTNGLRARVAALDRRVTFGTGLRGVVV